VARNEDIRTFNIAMYNAHSVQVLHSSDDVMAVPPMIMQR
jgi:hypothetical protein